MAQATDLTHLTARCLPPCLAARRSLSTLLLGRFVMGLGAIRPINRRYGRPATSITIHRRPPLSLPFTSTTPHAPTHPFSTYLPDWTRPRHHLTGQVHRRVRVAERAHGRRLRLRRHRGPRCVTHAHNPQPSLLLSMGTSTAQNRIPFPRAPTPPPLPASLTPPCFSCLRDGRGPRALAGLPPRRLQRR